jgi:hypothetical protein
MERPLRGALEAHDYVHITAQLGIMPVVHTGGSAACILRRGGWAEVVRGLCDPCPPLRRARVEKPGCLGTFSGRIASEHPAIIKILHLRQRRP